MNGLIGCLATVLFLAASPAGGQESDANISPKVDAYVAAEMQREKMPGLALGVMREGTLIKAQGYGLANVELNVAVKPESIFQTGSVGKQFTATAILMLVEEGKVALDDPISKYFPEAPAAWQAITIRHLLTHTSGIPDYGSDENVKNGTIVDLRKDYSEEELVRRFMALPLDFPPGSKWSYSNSAYVTLGVLIHRITGEFYGDFLEERIFRPLHMDATHIISEEDIVPNRSAGYRLVGGVLKNQEWVAPKLNTTADGALYTNVLDMAKWDAALTAQTLLKKSSYEQMYMPVRLAGGKSYPYGFGWGLGQDNGHAMIQHSGSWQGFTTNISRYPADHVSVVVLTNLDSAHAHPARIAHAVAAMYVAGLSGEEGREE